MHVANAFMGGLENAAVSTANNEEWYAGAIAASGVTPEEMEACAASEPVYDQLQAANLDPVIKTLTTLPTVLINGQVIEDPSYDGISEAIAAALGEAAAAPSVTQSEAPAA